MAKAKFSNEVNDLARFLEAVSSQINAQSQALSADSESATSAVFGGNGHRREHSMQGLHMRARAEGGDKPRQC
jgi:hypothetical protein